MILFEKYISKAKNRQFKEYKICGVTVLRKEKSPYKKKWNLIGIKLCVKRKIKKISYRFSLCEQIYHKIKKWLGMVLCYRQIKKNKNARILVILHLYYMDSWDSIKYYLQNLDVYCYDLLITYSSGHYTQSVFNKIKRLYPSAKFYCYENRGFDIGPFLDSLLHVNLNQYDIVYKLQSKGISRSRIFIYNQIFKYNDWFNNLYKGILGEFSVHKAIDVLMSDDRVGIVAAENLIVKDPKHKNFFTHQKAEELNICIPQDYHYVAGSCFAIKTDILKSIKELGLNINDFNSSKRGSFSLAHAMERIVCAVAEAQKYSLYGIITPHKRYKKELKKCLKKSALRLLDDDRFILDYDFFYKTLEQKLIADYRIEKIKLKNIRRHWQGKFYRLKDVSPYAYLLGDKERYEKYCEKNAKISQFQMTAERFDDLIYSIAINGFNPLQMPVIHGKDNVIWDGQHRCCYLLLKYGENHEIKVLHLY